MLAYSNESAWHIWSPGARLLSGMAPPPNAESLLSDNELAALGLYRVTVEPVPEGQVATAWTLIDLEGAPVYRPTLEDAPILVPHEITNYQMRTILRREGHRPAIAALIEGAKQQDPDAGAELEEAFEYANFVYRDGNAVASIAAALGWTSEYLDSLFIQAAEIVA